MPLENSLAYGQPEPRSRVFILMQALEQAENALGILLIEANPVVAERYDPVSLRFPCRDIDLRSGTLFRRYLIEFESKF